MSRNALMLLLLLVVSLGITPTSWSSDDTEGLSQFEVENVIQKNVPKLKTCFETARPINGVTDGRLLLDFKVNMKGRVADIHVDSPMIPGPIFRQCILQRLATWEFPLPRGGMDVEVQYPLLFRLKAPVVANTEAP